LLVPNDSRYAQQWALPKISAENAWDIEEGNGNVLIGIIDTGISMQGSMLTHPDLDNATRYILGTDFVNDDAIPLDDLGHGTHVAGTAGAETNNAGGVAGVNWNSRVYVCKVFDENGNGSESDFESAARPLQNPPACDRWYNILMVL
jgi:subtilisin family serine protease